MECLELNEKIRKTDSNKTPTLKSGRQTNKQEKKWENGRKINQKIVRAQNV